MKIRPLYGVNINANQIAGICLTAKKNHFMIDQQFLCANNNLSKEQRSVAIAIPYSMVINKTLKLPALLKSREIEAYIKFNCEKLLGVKKEEVMFDYRQLKAQGKLQVVATKQDYVQAILKQYQKYNFSIKAIDIEPFVLARIAIYFKFKNEAICYIEKERILFLVLANAEVVYIKEEPKADDLVLQINNLLQIYTELEQKKVTRLLYLAATTVTGISIPASQLYPELSPEMVFAFGLAMLRFSDAVY